MDDIIWDAPEFEHQERGLFWYYIIGLFAIALILFALWQGNFLFSVFILIATTALLLLGKNKPPEHRVTLSGQLITIGMSGSYPIQDFSGFVVREGGQNNQEWAKVLLRPKRRFRFYFPIMVPRERLAQIKVYLSSNLPELEHEESLMEELVRFFKL